MKKINLNFFYLVLLLLAFNLSCKKEEDNPQNTNCIETSTVNLTVTIPSGKTVLQSVRLDNIVEFVRFGNSDNYYIEYQQDIRQMGLSQSKVFVFKNLIPGEYAFGASIIYKLNTSGIPVACFTINISNRPKVTLVAGQTYNLTINANEFTCQP